MPREDDEHVQGDDDRVRRRRKDDDEDAENEDEDRPRRRRRREDDDDYDEDRPRRRRPRSADERGGGFLDDTFADTNIVILIIFPVVCGIIALLLGIAGVAACTRPLARRNAWIVLIISICWIAAATALYAMKGLGKV